MNDKIKVTIHTDCLVDEEEKKKILDAVADIISRHYMNER